MLVVRVMPARIICSCLCANCAGGINARIFGSDGGRCLQRDKPPTRRALVQQQGVLSDLALAIFLFHIPAASLKTGKLSVATRSERSE